MIGLLGRTSLAQDSAADLNRLDRLLAAAMTAKA
jgi:hypothetical protein